MSAQLALGDIVFADFEVPDQMPFGGQQAHRVHKLVGGARVIDAMGRDDDPKSWSGRFMGSDATERARHVDAMRIAGLPVALSWGEFAFTVLITAFVGQFQQPFDIPYSITVEVISDDAQPDLNDFVQTVDDQVGTDVASAQDYGAAVNDPQLTGHLTDLGSAVSLVPSFLNASSTMIGAVLTPLGSAQTRTANLIGIAETSLASLPGFAGVSAGAPAPLSASNLLLASANMGQCATLYNLAATLGRIGKNLGSIQASGSTVITDGLTNLYAYASRAYGDPAGWSTIARANGLTDPEVPGGLTLLIPTVMDGRGGVLSL